MDIILPNGQTVRKIEPTNKQVVTTIKTNKKLQEEVKEYLEDNNVEELADIVEVVYGILNSMNVTIDEFEKVRKNKKEKNGGFEKKIYLEEAE